MLIKWYHSLSESQFYIAITLLWIMWHRRNKILHEKCTLPDSYWIHKTLDTAKSFVVVTDPGARDANNSGRKDNTNSKWQKPKEGYIKVNVDARISTEGWLGLGMVARDTLSLIRAAGVKRIQTSVSPIVGEALSISFGLQIAIQMGWQEVELESDCLLLIHLIRSQSSNRHEEGVLIEDIQWQQRFFKDCVWKHIKREGNKVAHTTATLDPGADTPVRIWIENYPTLITTLAAEDL